jgi:hypothetical protein
VRVLLTDRIALPFGAAAAFDASASSARRPLRRAADGSGARIGKVGPFSLRVAPTRSRAGIGSAVASDHRGHSLSTRCPAVHTYFTRDLRKGIHVTVDDARSITLWKAIALVVSCGAHTTYGPSLHIPCTFNVQPHMVK